jgi:hypothetical protein
MPCTGCADRGNTRGRELIAEYLLIQRIFPREARTVAWACGLVLGAIGVAAAGMYALPGYAWLMNTLAGLGTGVSTVVTRPGTSTEFAYLQRLEATFPDATWRTETSAE